MKLKLPKFIVVRCLSIFLGFFLLPSPAETINWGNNVLDSLVTSNGTALVGTYVIQLGAFVNSSGTQVDPGSIDTSTWVANWKVFDQADFNSDFGYFTGSAVLSRSLVPSEYGRSSFAGADNIDFSNLTAYIWVRNEVTNTPPAPGTEWFLAHAGNWVFPQSTPTCCDNDLPLEWALSDLGTTTPKYGGQNSGSGGIQGPGLYTTPDLAANLQTYTFASAIPEPTTHVLLGVACVIGFLGYRRAQKKML